MFHSVGVDTMAADSHAFTGFGGGHRMVVTPCEATMPDGR